MKKVTLLSGTTAVRVKCATNGTLLEVPSISIYGFLREYLTEKEWDPRFKRSVVRYYYFKYDSDNEILHMPVYITGFLIGWLQKYNVEAVVEETPPNEFVTTNITYRGDLVPYEDQLEAIEFLATDSNPLRALSLTTGGGKSLIAIMAILKLQLRSLIILPASLVEQWAGVLSSLSDARVMVLRGNRTIYDIVAANYEFEADIILTSIQTMQDYATGGKTYEDAPPLTEFVKGLKVGIKLVDECHLNFHANVMVDIQSDVSINMYLSATHVRGNRASNTIFSRVYPNEIRYGSLSVSDHINVTECRYSLGQINPKEVSTERGYSQVKYEKYLLRRTGKFEQLIDGVFRPVVREYYIRLRKSHQKLLILVGRVDFARLLVEWLREDHGDLNVNGYFNETKDITLQESDIIVSTVGSCGTGKDIVGLRTMILFTSFGSEPLIYQTIGRLRKMGNGDTPEFVYLVNSAIPSQIRHANTKKMIYQNRVKDFSRIDL